MSEISNYIQEVFDEEDTIEEKQLTESLFLNNDNVYFNTFIRLKNEQKEKDPHYHILRQIFEKEWNNFKLKYRALLTRDGINVSIERMLRCQDPDEGYLTYVCPHCQKTKTILMTCKSRFCPTCGKKAREKQTLNVTRKLANVPHRQLVFSVPYDLRNYFRIYRDTMLNSLFTTVDETINSCMTRHSPLATKNEKRRLGFVSFLHTYGRDLKWHPHLHVLIAERYMKDDNKLHKFSYFSYEYLRKTFFNKLLHNMYYALKKLLKENLTTKTEINKFYKLWQELKIKYKDGYYVYGPRLKSFKDENTGLTLKTMKALTKYVARYASHPAISESRILSYDPIKHLVTWYYEPHEDDNKEESEKLGKQIITESAEEFIKKLIIHIPDIGFKMIRYYGFYSQASKIYPNEDEVIMSEKDYQIRKRNITFETLMMQTFGYSPFLCSCGHRMFLDMDKSNIPKTRRLSNYGIM